MITLNKVVIPAVLMCFFMLVASARAAETPRSFAYLGIEASYFDVQKGDNRAGNVDNFWQGAVHAAYRFNRLFSLQGQYGFAKTQMRHFDSDVKNHQFLLSARFHWYALEFGGFSPYLGVGYDYYKLKPEQFDETSKNAIFGEIGLQRMLGQHFMLDFGYRHIMTASNDKFVDRQPYIAINWVFGAAKPPAKPQPPIAQKPEPKCKEVPDGAKLDKDGCPVMLTQTMRITLHIEFAFNSNTVPDRYKPDIGKIAKEMRAYPNSVLLLVGHTDDVGSSLYNQNLSKSRADSVMNVLVNDFDISPKRIKTAGMGELQPIADNQTDAGRTENRRVEAVISGKKQVIDFGESNKKQLVKKES